GDEVADRVRQLLTCLPEVGHMVDVTEGDAGHLQAGPGGVAGEAAIVLDPGDPLLLDERHNLVILDQRRGRVVVLVESEYVHACVLPPTARSVGQSLHPVDWCGNTPPSNGSTPPPVRTIRIGS